MYSILSRNMHQDADKLSVFKFSSFCFIFPFLTFFLTFLSCFWSYTSYISALDCSKIFSTFSLWQFWFLHLKTIYIFKSFLCYIFIWLDISEKLLALTHFLDVCNFLSVTSFLNVLKFYRHCSFVFVFLFMKEV